MRLECRMACICECTRGWKVIGVRTRNRLRGNNQRVTFGIEGAAQGRRPTRHRALARSGEDMMTRNLSRREFGGLLAGMTAASTLASVGRLRAGRQVGAADLVGQPRPRPADQRGDRPLRQGDRDRGGAGDLRLERLLAEARHPGGGEEPAGPDPDGLPLHLRVRAPAAAGGAGRVRRQAAGARRLRPEPARLGQGRRQALRHLDGRQLDDATSTTRRCSASSGSSCPTRRPGPTTTSRRSACRSRTSCPRACTSIQNHGLLGAAAGELGAPARQGALQRGRPARLRARRPDRLLRLLEGHAGQGPDPARPTSRARTPTARWKRRCS